MRRKRFPNSLGVSGAMKDAANFDANDVSDYFATDELFPYIAEDDIAALRKEVLTSINNELVHAEELEVTVPKLLRSCANEAREVRRAMNALSSSQVVEASRSLAIVQDSCARVKELRELFIKQGTLISGMPSNAAYSQLRQLHFVHRNVCSIIDWTEALKEVRYDNIYKDVEARAFGDVYKRLCRLQKIRRMVIDRAGSQYRSYQGVFEAYFSKQDVILNLFVAEVLKFLEEESIQIAIQRALEDPEDDGGGVDRAASTVALGTNDDFVEFVQLRECIEVCGEELEHPALNYGSNGETDLPLSLESVRTAVQGCVGRVWEGEIMGDVVDPIGQMSEYLDRMMKVEALLTALELGLLPLSAKFPFFSTVVQAFHGEVVQTLSVYIDEKNDVDANGLMKAAQYARWYKGMLAEYGYTRYIAVETIDQLIAMMVTAAVGGMSMHLTRLCRATAITVCTDPNGPTALPTRQLITNGPMDLFSVLQQSLSALTASVELHVMQEIGKACADGIRAYLDECKQRSDYDYWEDENATSANPLPEKDWTERRAVLLYAFCNDCSAIENNLDTIEVKFASCWSDDADVGDAGGASAQGAKDGTDGAKKGSGGATGPVPDPFIALRDYIPEVTLYYLDEITLHVERVVGGQWELVFRSPEWYSPKEDTNPVQLIINSIAEYIEEEFTVLLHESRHRKITRQMLTRYTIKYLNTLLEYLKDVTRNPKKYAPADWNNFIDCIARDTANSTAMWKEHVTENRGQLVDLSRRALDIAKRMLSIQKPVDFHVLVQDDMMDEFGDCPTFVIRLLLDCRQDLPKDARDKMVTIWEERIAYQRRDKNDVPTEGWSQPRSFFGSVDRTIGQEEKRGFFSRGSNKKKREEEAAAKRLKEKEDKRAARLAKRAADASSPRVKGPSRFGGRAGGGSQGNQEVEVTTLQDLLK